MRAKLKTWTGSGLALSVLISLCSVCQTRGAERLKRQGILGLKVSPNLHVSDIFYKEPGYPLQSAYQSRQGDAPQATLDPKSDLYWELDESKPVQDPAPVWTDYKDGAYKYTVGANMAPEVLASDSAHAHSESVNEYAHAPIESDHEYANVFPIESGHEYANSAPIESDHDYAHAPVENSIQNYALSGQSQEPAQEFNQIAEIPEHMGLILLALLYFLAAFFLKGSIALAKPIIPCEPVHGLTFVEARPYQIPPVSHPSSLQKNMLDMFYGESDDSLEGPDMSHVASMCAADGFFYGMNPRHMQAVEAVKQVYMQQSGPDDMYSMAVALRHSPDLHPRVWYEGLMKASMERADMGGMVLPGPVDVFPDTFISGYGAGVGRSLSLARTRSSKKHKQQCVRVDGAVGVDNGEENRLWYWREDVMLNSHHWYWHMAYPIRAKSHPDRQGELFYYMHHSMLARYNIERLCNGMGIVEPMEIYPGSLMLPPYNAHLDDSNSGKKWTDRHKITPFLDIHHERNKAMPQTVLLKNFFENGRRIGTSLAGGYLISPQGKKTFMPDPLGIDLVGSTMEATDISFNPEYYDATGYHNQGHVLIGLSGDPNYVLKLPPGPMGDPATAMRDPIFYPWHTNIDNIFDSYKKALKPYQAVGGQFPLLWEGVHISQFRVLPYNGARNVIKTFFSEKKFELGIGLAFDRNSSTHGHEGGISVCAKHLDHQEFDYQLEIDVKSCVKSKSGTGTVRIYLAPKYDHKKNKFWLHQQRRLFVALDAFTVSLKAGKNLISRRSIDSSLTIPFAKTLQTLKEEFGSDPVPYCGCGWPQHLLLPKGTRKGKQFDLFVMVTNGDEDLVQDEKAKPETCTAAPIYCGIPNRKYPDARPMGYPFDRLPYGVPKGGKSLWEKVSNIFGSGLRPVETIEEYVSGIPNMGLTQIKIIHKH